jgi:L-ascorbate metabolism protein UlaG (beta-lactamase superfamily)
VGHATVRIQLDGAHLLTDPLLRPRVAHLRRVAPLSHESLRPPEAVLVSHLHIDHLDVRSLRGIGPPRLLAPHGAAAFLRRRGFPDVEGLAPGDSVDVGNVSVRAVPAVHDGRRFRLGRRVDAIGYVMAGSRTVYFAGDTDVFEGMASLGGLDVALVPIGGWGRRVGAGHLDGPRRPRRSPFSGRG